jgi:hypothetical protein
MMVEWEEEEEDEGGEEEFEELEEVEEKGECSTENQIKNKEKREKEVTRNRLP